MERTYIAIDLKSFYASVECVERGLDPLTTNLVVADASRTEKTICLAVSPSLKAYGIPGRARLFEVVQTVSAKNAERQFRAPGRRLTGSSWDAGELQRDPALAIDYIAAPPRMAHYIRCSAQVYQVYLNYVAPEDIHVYSIDEVFIDATNYLPTAGMTDWEFARRLVKEVYRATGITATAGIGTNLYLCKVAMDIVAKHAKPDREGVRAARLDEMTYRRLLWEHRPITDFWRVGRGYARKLEAHGLFTMGDVARCSIQNESLLYRLFGVNAELLIDHAWGWEPCGMAEIKAYKPVSNSIGSGQVLHGPYTAEKAKLIVREMTDQLVLDLVSKGLVTDRMVLTVGYDIENRDYTGPVTVDYYGRRIPKHAHGTAELGEWTSSTVRITRAVMELFERIVDPDLLVRRVNLVAGHVAPEDICDGAMEQMDLFSDPAQQAAERAFLAREKRRQRAILDIKEKFGKNAILKGMDLEEGATAMDRNRQIGGHKA